MELLWDDIRTVMMLVRHGTLAAAGQELGVNYTTVARRIQRAETQSTTPLFERLPDGYRPTAAGRLVAEHAQAMEASERALARALTASDQALSGTLTITAPQLLIAHVLGPVLETFSETYPQIDLRIRATNEILDLTRLEADLAIRISDTPGDSLKGRRLLSQQTASFAHPDVARDISQRPHRTIDWIVYEGHPTVPKDASPEHTHRVRYVFDDMVAILGAAQSGLGVARLPMFLGRSAPGLVQVPVLPPQTYSDIWVVGHRDVWPAAKLQAFRRILIDHCACTKHLFVQ